MAQLVARLVRNEKVGGSNPPSSTTGRHPIRMSVFCMHGCVVAAGSAGVPGAGGPAVGPGCLVCPWAAARPRAVRAASLRLGASSRSPARPRRRPRAPQPGPPDPPAPSTPAAPGVLMVFEARPGPATAHGHGSLAPIPPASYTPAAPGVLMVFEARPGPATARGHGSLALRTLRRPPHRRHLVY